jgi:Uncharacterized conserved protein (DUF2075)
MTRYYYRNKIIDFIQEDTSTILGKLVLRHEFSLDEQQRNSWSEQIALLKNWLRDIDGTVVFEFSIPRMGRRIDCVVLSKNVIYAIEFKVGSASYASHAIDQVVDYALDLKNFHEESHAKAIVPILICTKAEDRHIALEFYEDLVSKPLCTNGASLAAIIQKGITKPAELIDHDAWLDSGYKPTPTIIEAAQALYSGHSVIEISRSDAGAINLSKTAKAISMTIEDSKKHKRKSICFLTGVPGAGKTLAGLNLATSWHQESDSEHAVFLSGNGPLVDVLREALARNEVQNARESGERMRKNITLSKAKTFIQNIHHFRDDALQSSDPPIERVVIFDEAQRAWTLKQTAAFMKQKKGRSDFNLSEPEFLISVMNRHQGWATIVCLIGGGQEINTGEAGLKEWFDSLKRSFPKWIIYVSGKLTDQEYTQGHMLISDVDVESGKIVVNDDLHLAVSIRSFRSENVAAFVKALLDRDTKSAVELRKTIQENYPIFLTRDLSNAKNWLRANARGSERYGLVASSGAMRLKPHGVNVSSPIEPKNWFLNPKTDVRSSYYLEDVATEFDIQGLELDWTCVAWDADLRFSGTEWTLKSFRGTAWQDVKDLDAKRYLKNAYRVLLTRARQGMVLFVPQGDHLDPTRSPEFYDKTYEYLLSIGIEELQPPPPDGPQTPTKRTRD